MRVRAIALSVLALVPTVASAQAPEAPFVQVGIFKVRAGGNTGGYAATDPLRAAGQRFAIFLWTGNDGCLFGAADVDGASAPEVGQDAVDAWMAGGELLTTSTESAEVLIEWQRLRAGGQAVNGPKSSERVNMRLNQVVPLDSGVTFANICGPPVVFGARFANRIEPTQLAQRGSGAARGAGKAAGGAGEPTGPVPPLVPYTAELWLVHSVPGRPDEVRPMTVNVLDGDASFAFPRVRRDLPEGTFDVVVNGRLFIRRVLNSGFSGAAPNIYTVAAARAVTFTPANRTPRDSSQPRLEDMENWSGIGSELPGPDDVIAYEMPPLNVPDAPSVPDKFSIRLRLRPIR